MLQMLLIKINLYWNWNIPKMWTYLDYQIIPPSRNCRATLVILDKIKYKMNQATYKPKEV